MKLIVHISLTPLAGAPIRAVQAINEYTAYQARLINYNPQAYGSRRFPEDLNWDEHREESITLIKQADILHFHHKMEIDTINNPFKLNFKQINSEAKVVFQTHSTNSIKQSKLNKIGYNEAVVMHCAEREHFNAVRLPNIIDENDPLLMPRDTANIRPIVFFSPSSPHSVTVSRWETKAKPQVLKMLRKLQRQIDFEICVVEDTPYLDCMKLKQKADIIIDDITTGSFHLTALEGLSMGKPVINYLDGRTTQVTCQITQSMDLPFINSRLYELPMIIKRLIESEELRNQIGLFSREWVVSNYSAIKNVQHFENLYKNVLSDSLDKAPPPYELAKKFLYQEVYDEQWRSYFAQEFIKERLFWFSLHGRYKLKKRMINIASCLVLNKLKRKCFREKQKSKLDLKYKKSQNKGLKVPSIN